MGIRPLFVTTFLLLTTSLTAFAATDIKVEIRTDSDLTGIAFATYVATRKSFVCREFTWNDGSPTRIPKRRHMSFQVQDDLVTVPEYITVHFASTGGLGTLHLPLRL